MRNETIKQGISFKRFLLMNLSQKSKICIFFTVAYLLIAIIIASFIPSGRVDKELVNAVLYVTCSILFAPVLIFVTISFSYLYKKNAEDFFFSLPMKRTKMYWSTYITGFITSAVPIVLYAYTFYLLCSFNTTGLSVLPVTWIVIKMLLFLLCIYSFYVFIAVNTGSIISQLLMSVGSIVIIPAMFLGWALLAQNTLIGFDMGTMADNPAFFRLFYALRFLYTEASFDIISVLLILLIGAVFAVSGWMFFNKRKCESASKWLSFSVLYPLIKIIVVVTAASYTALLATGGNKMNLGIIIPMTIVSIVAYVITDMILEKSTRTFYSRKSLISFLIGWGGIALFCILLNNGFFGYSNRVPKEFDIQYVSIYMSTDNVTLPGNGGYGYESSENIEKIRKIHMKMIELSESSQEKEGDWRNPQNGVYMYSYIKYKLKNGFTVERNYYVGDRYIEQLAKSIQQTKESKMVQSKVMHVEAKDVSSITAQNANAYRFKDQPDIEKIVNALKQDTKNKIEGTKRSNTAVDMPGLSLTLIMKRDRWRDVDQGYDSYSIDASYSETIKVLRELQLNKKLSEMHADSSILNVDVDIGELRNADGKKIIVDGEEYDNIINDNHNYSFDGYSLFYMENKSYIDAIVFYCESHPVIEADFKNYYVVTLSTEWSSKDFYIPREKMPEPLKSIFEDAIQKIVK